MPLVLELDVPIAWKRQVSWRVSHVGVTLTDGIGLSRRKQDIIGNACQSELSPGIEFRPTCRSLLFDSAIHAPSFAPAPR